MNILIRFILGFFKNRQKTNFRVSDTQKILIYARMKIGDSIMVFPFLREMKKNNPNLQIDVLATVQSDFMYRNNPNVNKTYTMHKKLKFFTRTILIDWFELKRNNYDVILDLEAIRVLSFVYLALLKAKVYLSANHVNRYGIDLQKFDFFDNIKIEKDYMLQSKNILKNLTFFDYTEFDDSLEVFTTPQKQAYAKKYFQTYKNSNKKIIAFNVLGSSLIRSMNEKDYMYILTELSKIDNVAVFMITMPQNKKEVQQNIQGMDNIFLAYDTKDIFDVIALVEQVDVLITPDTALVHIANALKKDAVGIYSSNINSIKVWHDKNSTVVDVRSSHTDTDSIQGFSKDDVLKNVNLMLNRQKNEQ